MYDIALLEYPGIFAFAIRMICYTKKIDLPTITKN